METDPAGQSGSVAIVIPAYRPEPILFTLVEELVSSAPIVVVDDGSGAGYQALFSRLEQIPGVQVVHHEFNQGKGAALKTAFQYGTTALPDALGLITVDADGQHRPEDVLSLMVQFRAHPSCLILGARAFEGDIPLRSRVGNVLTRVIFRLVTGVRLKDTQTGLRAIPTNFARSLLTLPSSGYDFELDMLVAAKKSGTPILEIPIQTIYEPGNKSSHFNPLVDSMKVYFVLARFCSVSLVTALLDNMVFSLVYHQGGHLLGAQCAGRLAALAFNYVMVKEKVFHAGRPDSLAFPRYLALLLGSGTASYTAVRLALHATHAPVLLIKLIVESLLFFVNFTIQRDWVFPRPASDR